MKLTKMQGLGNSQIIVEDLNEDLIEREQISYEKIAMALGHTGFGVGSDQVLIILPSEKANFRMRIFNRDGGEAEMCGNGIRCVAKYLFDKDLVDRNPTIETEAGVKELEIFGRKEGAEIEVDMGKGVLLEENEEVKGFKGTRVSVGNPHFVVITGDASKKLALNEGPELENADAFQPEKANIEFANPLSRKVIETYVWERGAGLTLACGTGACATAFVARKKGLVDSEVKIKLLGGSLTIEVDEQDRIRMKGPAEYILRGEVYDVSRIYSHISDI